MPTVLVVDEDEIPGTRLIAGKRKADRRKLRHADTRHPNTLPTLESVFSLHVVPHCTFANSFARCLRSH